MITDDFSIFKQMVNIAKEQGMEYKILYSKYTRKTSTNFSEVYSFLLLTATFNLLYNNNHSPEETYPMDSFAVYENCIQVNFKIKSSDGNILLEQY